MVAIQPGAISSCIQASIQDPFTIPNNSSTTVVQELPHTTASISTKGLQPPSQNTNPFDAVTQVKHILIEDFSFISAHLDYGNVTLNRGGFLRAFLSSLVGMGSSSCDVQNLGLRGLKRLPSQKKSGTSNPALFLDSGPRPQDHVSVESHHTLVPTSSFFSGGYFNLMAINDQEEGQAAPPHGACHTANLKRETTSGSLLYMGNLANITDQNILASSLPAGFTMRRNDEIRDSKLEDMPPRERVDIHKSLRMGETAIRHNNNNTLPRQKGKGNAKFKSTTPDAISRLRVGFSQSKAGN